MKRIKQGGRLQLQYACPAHILRNSNQRNVIAFLPCHGSLMLTMITRPLSSFTLVGHEGVKRPFCHKPENTADSKKSRNLNDFGTFLARRKGFEPLTFWSVASVEFSSKEFCILWACYCPCFHRIADVFSIGSYPLIFSGGSTGGSIGGSANFCLADRVNVAFASL